MKDVQPIFRKHCFECHGSGNEEGSLNLGIRARVMEGGEHGPAIVKGDSLTSLLIHRIASQDENQVMPPDGERLSDEQIGILRAWIDQGAEWPSDADVKDPRLERARQHWAFQRLGPVSVPESDSSWPKTSIDRFILDSLNQKGLIPSEQVSARKLIRRIYFDVIGLPPTPEQIEKFVGAAEADWDRAVDGLVDELLNSRHYGERWGRHWLDVVRYADSDGQEADRDRPHAWRYRDFVIRALNEDMSFDQFIRWQIAGDEYEP